MRRCILIVEDNDINRQLLREILIDEYEILEAIDGKEALALMRQKYECISAVVLDIVMPVLDGYEVLKQMRRDDMLSKIPVIVTTASTDHQAEVKALSLGAKDFVVKPYNSQIIKHRLRNTIKLRETAAIINATKWDSLTGLYSRNAFFEKASEMIGEKEAGYYVMVGFDIDNFKVINDQYGNKKGDDVLRFIADTIHDKIESLGGICCRITADNFALLYPACHIDTKPITKMWNKVIALDGSIMPITFSVGRYIADDLSLTANAMYDRALIAKASIKGRYDVHVAYYDESMRERILREQEITSEMNIALTTGQFEAWLQPQYNHATGALIGAEALVRWRHPKKGIVPPFIFIPVFEKNGFIYEMDKYIWERVCIALRSWMDAGRTLLPVSVNISRYDIFRDDMVDVLTGLVEKYEIPIDLLRLEVTESAFAQSTLQIIEVVKKLVDYGFTVEIDDFGSGYSSLNTLKDVPAHVVKLDMKFLKDENDSDRGGNILESVIRMVRWLGMSVIAEGVETMEQADYLCSIGCNYVQGYLYAKPMPIEEYEALAATCEKEERVLALEAVETPDHSTIWNPKSLDTLIFNSYVGGACIFEYFHGKFELLRVNKKYVTELLGVDATIEDAMNLDIERHMDEQNQMTLHQNIAKAIDGWNESSCDVAMNDLPNRPGVTYLFVVVRAIAKAGEHVLFYSVISDITMQKVDFIKTKNRYEHELKLRQGLIRDSIAHFEINLTNRLIMDYSTVDSISNASLGSVMNDDLQNEILETIIEEDKERVKNTIFSQALYDAYQRGETNVMIEYRRMVGELGTRWVRADVAMSMSPDTGDILAFLYVKNIDVAKKNELAFGSIMDEEFETIVILNVKSGLAHFAKIRQNFANIEEGKLFQYDEYVKQYILPNIPKKEQKAYSDFILSRGLVGELEACPIVVFAYSVKGKEKQLARKRIRAFYLDDRKEDIVILRRDITDIIKEEEERKRVLQDAVNAAKKANHAKSEFLSRMSHDMRTPMNAIIGMVGLAKDEEDIASIREYLDGIDTSSHFLLALINDILDISRIESGRIDLYNEPYTIEEFTRNVNIMIQPMMDAKDIRFVYKMDPGIQSILVDKVRFSQIFFNLLSNAARFTPNGGYIEFLGQKISNQNKVDGVRFIVRDNGAGMTKERMKSIFEPFSQEQIQDNANESSSGLGLAIAKRLVDAMGGSISVSSEPGRGSEFIVDFYTQVNVEAETSVIQEKKVYACLKDVRILLVEDNEINTIVATRILGKQGCIVEVAENGFEAVKMFHASDIGYYQMILMDVRMPIMNGLEATKKIRASERDDAKSVPIIAMTADAFLDDQNQTKEAGMNAHIAKPIEAEILYDTIAQFFESFLR